MWWHGKVDCVVVTRPKTGVQPLGFAGGDPGQIRYSAQPYRAHKLDLYKDIVDERLAELPRLSALIEG